MTDYYTLIAGGGGGGGESIAYGQIRSSWPGHIIYMCVHVHTYYYPFIVIVYIHHVSKGRWHDSKSVELVCQTRPMVAPIASSAVN